MVAIPNHVLIMISVVFEAIALVLAAVGIGTPNWQMSYTNTTSGELRLTRTANFFYACRLNLVGEVLGCADRSPNNNMLDYYKIRATGNATDWNYYLNIAAGFSITGIIFLFLGIIMTLAMFYVDRAEWILLPAPLFLFIACLSMLVGLANGSRVLRYNGYAANLYEAAHLLTIFSFLISAVVAGRLFRPPLQSTPSRNIKRTR